MLLQQIEDFIKDIQLASVEKSADKVAEIEQFRVKYLGKKGVISNLFEQFKMVPNDQKKEIGQALNRLKTVAQNRETGRFVCLYAGRHKDGQCE